VSLAPDDPRHGTHTGYHNHGCRCEPCREACRVYNRERAINKYQREWRHRTGRGRPLAAYRAEVEPEHGTESRYVNRGCRCDDCMDAAKDARARRRRAPNVKVHNRNGYCNGCRCDVCREAQRVYAAERRAGAAA
jgi:hypothetical protein